jgi:ribosome-associated heat shock protein Hsp15
MRWDQWLWNVRLYRSRSLAQEAIKDGRVLVDGVAIKPAREARAGETVSARTGDITRVYRVLGFPPRRVSAPEVAAFAQDLTPPEAREEARQKVLEPGFRPRGAGRPTKRERRQIERWSDPG